MLKAAYYAVVAVEGTPSVRSVAAMYTRITGDPIWHEFVRKWLSSDTLAIQHRYSSDTPTVLKNDENDTAAIQQRAPRARVAKVLELNIASDTAYPQRAKPKPRQTKLIEDAETQARAILAAFWPLVQPALSSNGRATMTKTAWLQRNKATALDLARCGVDLEDLVAAHTAASLRMGSVVYSLRIVQDQLARPATPVRHRSAPSADAIARAKAYCDEVGIPYEEPSC